METNLRLLTRKVPKLRLNEFFLNGTKAGPNGPRLITALEDYVAVMAHDLAPKIDRVADEVARQCSGQSIKSSWPKWPEDAVLKSAQRKLKVPVLNETRPYQAFRSVAQCGRLGFISEKAGKVRVVAMGDYYSQSVLKPIHDFFMNILRLIPEDCTFNQQVGAEFLMKESRKGSFLASYDHTSCTDLFPIEPQRDVVAHYLGEEMADAWLDLVQNREFLAELPDGSKEMVRWSKGQPMGLYSSWPVMALTHHALVRHCAASIGVRPHNAYVILGDDIAICHEGLAGCYLQTVMEWGMEINLSKSFVSGRSTPSGGEFAKRQFVLGEELTPLPTALVSAAVKDWRIAPLLVDTVRNRLSGFGLQDAQEWILSVWPKQAHLLVKLLTVPKWLGGFGFKTNRPLREELVGGSSRIPMFVLFLVERLKRLEQESHQTLTCDAEEKFSAHIEDYDPRVLREHPFVRVEAQRMPEMQREKRPDYTFPSGRLGHELNWLSNLVYRVKQLESQHNSLRPLSVSPMDWERRLQRQKIHGWLRAWKRETKVKSWFLSGSEAPVRKILKFLGFAPELFSIDDDVFYTSSSEADILSALDWASRAYQEES